MSITDATHDASLRSWVESANDPATDFPIQNLPFGRFRGRSARCEREGFRRVGFGACVGMVLRAK